MTQNPLRLFTLLFPLLLTAACTHVDAGNVGVEVNSCSGGGVNPTPLGVGYHGTGPCVDIIEFPTYMQTIILTKAPHEGSSSDDSLSVNDSDGLKIGIDVSMSFTVDGAKAPGIYTKYRKDLWHIATTYMRQSIREGVQEVFGDYKAEQLYGVAKEKARKEIETKLKNKIGEDGFKVEQFTINRWEFPEQVTNAITAKVAMTQEAQRANQEVAKREAEGRQRIAQATGEATAMKLKADAEAYMNQKLASSLSPVLVEYLKVQKWDGRMPQVQGGSGSSFISLSAPTATIPPR